MRGFYDLYGGIAHPAKQVGNLKIRRFSCCVNPLTSTIIPEKSSKSIHDQHSSSPGAAKPEALEGGSIPRCLDPQVALGARPSGGRFWVALVSVCIHTHQSDRVALLRE